MCHKLKPLSAVSPNLCISEKVRKDPDQLGEFLGLFLKQKLMLCCSLGMLSQTGLRRAGHHDSVTGEEISPPKAGRLMIIPTRTKGFSTSPYT